MLKKIYPLDLSIASYSYTKEIDGEFHLQLATPQPSGDTFMVFDDYAEAVNMQVKLNRGLRGDYYEGFVSNVNERVE